MPLVLAGTCPSAILSALEEQTDSEDTVLAFIDESGTPHPRDSCPISTLVALCMQEREHRGVSRQLYRLRKSLLECEDPYELKALDLLTPRTFSKSPAKRELAEATSDGLASLNVTIFAIVMPRPRNLPDTPADYLPTQHQYLFQRINALAEDMGEEALGALQIPRRAVLPARRGCAKGRPGTGRGDSERGGDDESGDRRL